VAVPFLSIIVPVYNRERLVARCMDSILRQEWSDYEIVAVDDGSTDGSAVILSRYPEVRLIRHERNRGVMQARSNGLRHARGLWSMFLDSDDELVEGSLATVHRRLVELPPNIEGALFCCRLDDGSISPTTPPPAVLDYESYLRYVDGHLKSEVTAAKLEFLHCIRASCTVHRDLLMQNGLEDLLHFEFYKEATAQFFPDVVRLYHQDADNQLVKRLVSDKVTDLALARDRANSLAQLIARHGRAMRRVAPNVFYHYVSSLAVLEFLLGRRFRGIWFGLRAFVVAPLSLRSWVVLIAGLLGKGFVGWLRAIHIRKRADSKDKKAKAPASI
jgi:glycosyltransferase involved in cell wall biosynthesis